MEKYDRHVAVHAQVAMFGCLVSAPASLLLFIPGHSSLASALGYGLPGALLFTAMMLLIARAVESLTRRYGAAEEAVELGWRLDAAVCVLVPAFFLAYCSAAAAIYHAFGHGADFDALLFLMLGTLAVMVIVAVGYRWIICQLYRYLLWVRFGAKRAAAISLARGSDSPEISPFLLKGSQRQYNIQELMPCIGIYLGCIVGVTLVRDLAHLDFAIRYIDGFAIHDYLMSELLHGILVFLGVYGLIYLGAIANNAWHARVGGQEAGKLDFCWKQAWMACMFALILFPAQVVLMSAIAFAVGFKLGCLLLLLYFMLLMTLFDKKWVRAGLADFVSQLEFGKKGVA